MKRFFTLIGVGVFILTSFTFCDNKVVDTYRPVYIVDYLYKNHTDDKITIICYDYGTHRAVMEIPAHKEYNKQRQVSGGFPDYPMWGYQRLIIKSGDIKIIQEDSYFNDSHIGLFDENNYELVEETDWYRKYVYIFTDDFFENGNWSYRRFESYMNFCCVVF